MKWQQWRKKHQQIAFAIYTMLRPYQVRDIKVVAVLSLARQQRTITRKSALSENWIKKFFTWIFRTEPHSVCFWCNAWYAYSVFMAFITQQCYCAAMIWRKTLTTRQCIFRIHIYHFDRAQAHKHTLIERVNEKRLIRQMEAHKHMSTCNGAWKWPFPKIQNEKLDDGASAAVEYEYLSVCNNRKKVIKIISSKRFGTWPLWHLKMQNAHTHTIMYPIARIHVFCRCCDFFSVLLLLSFCCNFHQGYHCLNPSV